MDTNNALNILSAISQETRLQIFCALAKHGEAGCAAGILSKELNVPHNTLSFHLSYLNQAGLVSSTRQGRSIIYTAEISRMKKLAKFLIEDCCLIDKSSKKDKKKKKKKKKGKTLEPTHDLQISQQQPTS